MAVPDLCPQNVPAVGFVLDTCLCVDLCPHSNCWLCLGHLFVWTSALMLAVGFVLDTRLCVHQFQLLVLCWTPVCVDLCLIPAVGFMLDTCLCGPLPSFQLLALSWTPICVCTNSSCWFYVDTCLCGPLPHSNCWFCVGHLFVLTSALMLAVGFVLDTRLCVDCLQILKR